MLVSCDVCGERVEVPADILPNQNILCPYCNRKFPYRAKRKRRTWRMTVLLALGVLCGVMMVVLMLVMRHLRQSERIVDIQVAARLEDETQDCEQTQQQREREAENRAAIVAEHESVATDVRNCLLREKDMLERVVTESARTLEEIAEDRRRLSDILAEIACTNQQRAALAATSGWKRFEKAECVMMYLKHPGMNALALKYLGEDFEALKAECRSKVKEVVGLYEKTAKGLALNREKYDRRITGIDDDVDKKTSKAQSDTIGANSDMERRLRTLEDKRNNRVEVFEALKKRNPKTKAVEAEILKVQDELVTLEKEIGRVKEVVAVSRANVAHVAATIAETGARRKGDDALSKRQDDDNALHAQMAHERSVFALASQFEGRSLDAIRSSMRGKTDVMTVRMKDANRRLESMCRAVSNVDMMSTEELKALKGRLVKDIQDRVMGDIQKD